MSDHKKLCELSHYSCCCWKLPLGHWRLPRATVSCHHLSTCQVDTTRCTEQYRTWHTIFDELLPRAPHAMSVLIKIFLLRSCLGNYLHACIALLKLTPTCNCFQICAWSPQLSHHGLQIRHYCQNSINLAPHRLLAFVGFNCSSKT